MNKLTFNPKESAITFLKLCIWFGVFIYIINGVTVTGIEMISDKIAEHQSGYVSVMDSITVIEKDIHCLEDSVKIKETKKKLEDFGRLAKDHESDLSDLQTELGNMLTRFPTKQLYYLKF